MVCFKPLAQRNRIDARRVQVTDDQSRRLAVCRFNQRFQRPRKTDRDAQGFSRAANLRGKKEIINNGDYFWWHVFVVSEARPSGRTTIEEEPSLTVGFLTPQFCKPPAFQVIISALMSVTEKDANDRIEIGNQGQLPAPPNLSRLIVASYNIRYAVGSHLILSGLMRKLGYNFPQPRPTAVAENIRTAARTFSDNALLPPPDILALQEADKATARAGGRHVAAQLAHELDLPYVHVGAGLPRGIKPKQREWWLNFEEQIGVDEEGDTGVALLSRVPLDCVTRIDLPWHDCAWRPRLAMAATINFGDQKLRLFNAHIDPHGPPDNQHQQTEAVLEEAQKHDGPVIVLGDFNTLSRPKANEIRKLMEAHDFSTPFPTGIATWRGAGLRFHADWIFVRDLRADRWGVARPPKVSDHWPIWAEISLPIANCNLPI